MQREIEEGENAELRERLHDDRSPVAKVALRRLCGGATFRRVCSSGLETRRLDPVWSVGDERRIRECALDRSVPPCRRFPLTDRLVHEDDIEGALLLSERREDPIHGIG
ncbi:MAG: hypothetical protein HYY06_12695 [Deltaproteobacteria bacterium]|nr:hypothetical protein [Deltaproteobacteria bacterium]